VGARAEAPRPGRRERRAVDRLDAVGAALLRELRERAFPTGCAHHRGACAVARNRNERLGECVGVARRDEEARATVLDDLRQAADVARDHGAAPLHRLERDHSEPLAERRHDDDLGPLEDRLWRRHASEERDDVDDPES